MRKPLCVHTVTVASFYLCMCTEPLTPLTWQINVLNVTLCIGLNYFLFLSTPSHGIILYLQDRMQHAAWTFDPSDIPWILQNLPFPHTSFWRESFLNISNHLPVKLICIFANYSFDLCWQLSWMSQLLTLGASFSFSWVSWLLNFIELRRASFDTLDITNYIEITWSSCQNQFIC